MIGRAEFSGKAVTDFNGLWIWPKLLTLLECHQHHVESCIHRYRYILFKFKIAFRRNANATSIDAV